MDKKDSVLKDKLVSKLLVLDENPEQLQRIKIFCDENNLVPLKVRGNRLMSVLQSNIDLGAILFSETYGGSMSKSEQIALKIHTIRPELPIIIRRETNPTLDDLSDT